MGLTFKWEGDIDVAGKIIQNGKEIETGDSSGKTISKIEYQPVLEGDMAGQPGATDTYLITYTDNTTDSFNVYNGKDGEQGDKGDTGEKGETGEKGDKGEDGKTPTINEDGNWEIDGVDTGISAGGASGTINVKTGRFQTEPNGNILNIITYPPRFTEGRCFLFDNNYYGIEDYKITKVSDIYDTVQPIEIDTYNSAIHWNGQGTFFDFIIQRDKSTGRNFYHFFKNENLSDGRIAHYIHQTDGDVFEEYFNLTQTGSGDPIYPMTKDARKINKIINLSSGLYLFCEENERIVIYTNNETIVGSDKTQFREISPAGNRLMHINYEFWSQGNFIFIKDNNANRVDIWDTLIDEMFSPMIKDENGEFLNLDLQYITYFPVAKVFIGYSEMEGLLYYCKNDGIGDLSDWQYARSLGFAPGQYYFNNTENYLFIPQETEIGVFNKDFEKITICQNSAILNNTFETNQGIIVCDNTSTFGYNFEKKEMSIEDAINSLI